MPAIQWECARILRRSALFLAAAGFVHAQIRRPLTLDERQFRELMETVAAGWRESNARKAADCFSEDAIYIEPPDRQVYKGRKELFEFFGGTQGTSKPMRMDLHHLAFDQRTQTGFAEYTFALNNQYHGIVIVRLREGKIQSWREYQYRSALPWAEFAGAGRF